MKNAFLVTGKVALLTVVIAALFSVGAGALIPSPAGAAPLSDADAQRAGLGLVVLALVDAVLLAAFASSSRLPRVRRALALGLGFFGAAALLGQIETLVFLTKIDVPAGVAFGSLALWAIVAVVVAPLACRLFGDAGDAAAEAFPWSGRDLAVRLPALGVVYTVLYFMAGYYVAWRVPAVHEYYRGTDPGSFLAHMGTVVEAQLWLMPFQVGRGMLWVAVVLPLIASSRLPLYALALLVGALLSLPLNLQHLMPNPWMPEAVAMVHLVETASSTFLFGLVATIVMALPPMGGKRDARLS